MEDWGGDADVDSSSAVFDGGFTMSGKAMGRAGQVHEVGFTVDVKANAGVEWQEDESPTGWNYSRDEPTYTSSAYAEAGEPEVTLVQFADGMEFIVDNDSLYLEEAQKVISPVAMKQLLNPEIYKKLVGRLFDDRAGKLDPPEQEFDEPERDYGDSRY